MNKKYLVVIAAVLIVIGLALVYFARRGGRTITRTAVTTSTPSVQAPAQSLGGQIYKQSKNPLQNKLPDTNPVKNANPIQNLNANPF